MPLGSTWLGLLRNLCTGTGRPLLGSPDAIPSPALDKPSASASPHRPGAPAPDHLHDTNLNSLHFPVPNLHQDHYKWLSQSTSAIVLEAEPRSNTTIHVVMGGYRDWSTLGSSALNLTVPSSCQPLWRPSLTGAFPDLHSKSAKPVVFPVTPAWSAWFFWSTQEKTPCSLLNFYLDYYYNNPSCPFSFPSTSPHFSLASSDHAASQISKGRDATTNTNL